MLQQTASPQTASPVGHQSQGKRGAVFSDPGRCRRSGISYNAGLHRYLWWQWDVGPGETGCFPMKGMSPDGRTLHRVFSGDDAFSVRKATLTRADGQRLHQSEGSGDID